MRTLCCGGWDCENPTFFLGCADLWSLQSWAKLYVLVYICKIITLNIYIYIYIYILRVLFSPQCKRLLTAMKCFSETSNQRSRKTRKNMKIQPVELQCHANVQWFGHVRTLRFFSRASCPSWLEWTKATVPIPCPVLFSHW